MNTIEIRERLNEKLDNLSKQELSSVLDFVQSLNVSVQRVMQPEGLTLNLCQSDPK